MNLRLSPKHGVNPALGVCPCCLSNPNGEILLLGRLPNDAQAPRHVVGRSLCATCTELQKTHVALREGSPDGPKANGRMVWVRDAYLRQMLTDGETLATTLRERRALVDPEIVDRLEALAAEQLAEQIKDFGEPLEEIN